jgi:KDO2-lipid IV(A) lauroyltransferase
VAAAPAAPRRPAAFVVGTARTHSTLNNWRARAPYYAYRAAGAIAEAVPAPAATVLARMAGRAMARTMRGRRRLVARHLQRVHGGALDDHALADAVRQAFDSYARYWMEAFRLTTYSPDYIDAHMSSEGIGHIDDALALGNGVIVAVTHLGNWDFGGAWIARRGTPLLAVAEDLQPPELFEWFADTRRAVGIEIVRLGPDAGTAILRTLKANHIALLMCDRDIGGGGVEVELFGERTTLPAGPATLALRTGAPLLPAAVYFEGDTGHLAYVRPPLPLAREGRMRADVARVTQALAREIELLVRRDPIQWHIFQPNWPSDYE